MTDMDVDSQPLIKIEVKEEYEENSFSDAGCSFDTSIVPYSNDEEIEVKDEPCDFHEDCENSVKLEVKEEFPCSKTTRAPKQAKKIRNKQNMIQKQRRRLYHEENMLAAVVDFKNGMSINSASKKYNVLRITLSYKLKGTSLEKTFLCYHCHGKYPSLQSLRSHVKCHVLSSKLNHFAKNIVKKENIEGQCEYCNRRYKRLSMLKKHIRSHQKARAWLCKLCTYETNTPGNLRKHVRACHTDTFSYHRCNFCKFESPILRELMAHVLKHEDVKLHQCLLCNYRAPKLSDIKKHERNHHIGKDKYLCHFCDFEGKTSKLLKLHTISEHQNEKAHMCQFCPFTTSRPGDLKRHMMSLHLALKLYQCKVCNYKAVKAGDLNRHIMDRHSDNKPHKCDICDYKAKRAEHLRSHLLCHQGNCIKEKKLRVCDLCGYKTLYRSSLNRHVKTKHIKDENSFRCSLCDFWSLQLDVIKKHINEYHF